MITDQKAIDFISSKLFTVPHLESIYHTYPRHVLQADLLRYLLLWFWGGFYADIDIYPKMPVTSCGPLVSLFTGVTPNVSLVVGVEVDEPYASASKRRAWKWSRTHGFIQYSIYAPRRFSPILRKVIVRGIAHSLQHQGNTATWYRRSGHFDDEAVLETTGPGMFTDAILDSLSDTLPPTHFLKVRPQQASVCPHDEESSGSFSRARGIVSWFPFHKLRKSLWVADTEPIGLAGYQRNGGILVLPINVWGNGQRHSGAGDFNNPDACLNHRFVRTWKQSAHWL